MPAGCRSSFRMRPRRRRRPCPHGRRGARPTGRRVRSVSVLVVKVLFWASLALLAWTHLLYPLAAALVARLRPRPVREADVLPTVALVIAAYNEEDVIEAKLENALALDYPRDRLRIVVASDASDDRTDEIVRSYAARGVELSAC